MRETQSQYTIQWGLIIPGDNIALPALTSP